MTTAACDRCATGLPSQTRDTAARRAEADGWHRFHSLVDRLEPGEALIPGYFAEGWSVRDVVAHVGAWLAEAGMLLEQMRMGTYVEGELDVDEANARFFDLMRDVPLDVALHQAWASRGRMLAAWSELPTLGPPARFWLAKAGAEHYDEHLPRLEAWVAELTRARRAPLGS